jgi:tRNA threonylcarbamoyl adenosine modification protein YeaZ
MAFRGGIAERSIIAFAVMNVVIETSSSSFAILFAKGHEIIFDSANEPDLKDTKDLASWVEFGLQKIGHEVREIEAIAVNIGPGGLSFVRTGVAFANGLAFSLGIPVCPVSSFELMGVAAAKTFQMPILCTMKASGGNAYAGLYDRGSVIATKFGVMAEVFQAITKDLAEDLTEFAVTGTYRNEVLQLLPQFKIHDSKIQICQAKTFLEIESVFDRRSDPPYSVSPLTEQSAIFQ